MLYIVCCDTSYGLYDITCNVIDIFICVCTIIIYVCTSVYSLYVCMYVYTLYICISLYMFIYVYLDMLILCSYVLIIAC